MTPPRQGDRKKAPTKSTSKPKAKPQRPRRQPTSKTTDPVTNDDETSPIDLSATIPIALQQLLLDTFKNALLTQSEQTLRSDSDQSHHNNQDHEQDHPDSQHTNNESDQPSTRLDTKSLVQTIKSHLYQRDFDSAFADADEALLSVYALRWSAARALGYAGIFKGVLGWMGVEASGVKRDTDEPSSLDGGVSSASEAHTRVVCLGGGAGAEIVALAAAWRDLGVAGEIDIARKEVEGISLEEVEQTESGPGAGVGITGGPCRRLDIAAVDIADWSSVVNRLSKTMVSSDIPTSKTSKYQPPLVPNASAGHGVSVSFHRSDVLSISDSDLRNILLDSPQTPSSSPNTQSSLLITLMFTLNELFSTSMSKATSLLLRMSDFLPSGAVLLVVDSPGSYSTLKLGKGKDGLVQERKYPMKFLLDHTLLSVAEGKWERVFTQDSRWWRREAARLRYEVGEGVGLEDMRFQMHVYRRV